MTTFIATAIPAAIDALIARLAATQELRGVQIIDGPPIEDVQQDVIAIGLSPDTLDISTQATVTDLAGLNDEETFEILGFTRSWSGDGDLGPRRAKAFELLDGVQTAIKSDLTLGGVVGRARLSRAVYVPIRAAEGVIVTVPFFIEVNTY